MLGLFEDVCTKDDINLGLGVGLGKSTCKVKHKDGSVCACMCASVCVPITNICDRRILPAHEGNSENIMTKLFSLWDFTQQEETVRGGQIANKTVTFSETGRTETLEFVQGNERMKIQKLCISVTGEDYPDWTWHASTEFTRKQALFR